MNSGIYAIVNKINGRRYYGSTINFALRKIDHFKTLRSKNHRNPHLQNSFNKYGEVNFEFVIIEQVPIENLLTIEQKYLDVNTNGYNIAKNAQAARRGIPCSDATKQKISNSLKGKKQSLNSRKKSSNTQRKRLNGKCYWYSKKSKKYQTAITYFNKKISLGAYLLEEDAKSAIKKFMLDTQNMSIKIKGNKLGASIDQGRGYIFNKDKDKYIVRITRNGKRRYIGQFNTEQEASVAVEKARKDNPIIF
jgi:group I intron endonuclease